MSRVFGSLKHTNKFSAIDKIKWYVKIRIVESSILDYVLLIFGVDINNPTKYYPVINKYLLKVQLVKILSISIVLSLLTTSYLFFINKLNLLLATILLVIPFILPPVIVNVYLNLLKVDRRNRINRDLIPFLTVMSIYASMDKIEAGFRALVTRFRDILSVIVSELRLWIIKTELGEKSIDDIAIQETSYHPSEEFKNLIVQFINFKYTGGDIATFFIDRLDKKINELRDKWDITWKNISSNLEIILIIFGLSPILISLTGFIMDVSTLHRLSYILYIIIPLIGLLVYIIIDGKFPHQTGFATKYPIYIIVISIVSIIIYLFFLILSPGIIIHLSLSIMIAIIIALLPISIYGLKLWKVVREEEYGTQLFLESAEEWLRHGYSLENIIDKLNVDGYPNSFKKIILSYRGGLYEGLDPDEIINKINIHSRLVYLIFKIINEILIIGGGLREIIRLRRVFDSYTYVKRRIMESSILPIIMAVVIPSIGVYSIKIINELLKLVITSNFPILWLSLDVYRIALSTSINILILGVFVSSTLLAKTISGSLKYVQFILPPLISLLVSLIIVQPWA